MYDQHIAARGDDRNRSEVLIWIEGQLLMEARVHGQGGVEHEPERVSVRRRLSDNVRPYIAAYARPILDHERLFETDRQLVGNRPRDDVAWPTGIKRDDELD